MRKVLLLAVMLLVFGVVSSRGQSQCSIAYMDEVSGMDQWLVTQIVQKNNQSLTAAPQSGGKSLARHRKPANHCLFLAHINSPNTGIRTIVTGIRTDFAGIRKVTN